MSRRVMQRAASTSHFAGRTSPAGARLISPATPTFCSNWRTRRSVMESEFDPARIETLLRSLLSGEFTSLTIGFNDLHACNYTTAQGWSDQMGPPDGGMQTYNDHRDWASDEE